ncbi:MAG: tetratricopeptide repeat protein [Bacteroidia bacterium]|nr:tetratricopeptide repeat protein [Bacteroidia bacterium]
MKKLILFLLISIVTSIHVYSQEQGIIDSLLVKLQTASEDTHKVKIINDLGFQLISSDPEKALQYANLGLSLAEQLGYKQGIAKSFNHIGIIHRDQDNYEKALEFYLKALKIREEIGDKKGIAASMNGIGVVYFYQGNYEKTINFFIKALKLEKEFGNKRGIASNMNNIGVVYEKQNKYIEAIEYYEQSLKIRKEIKDNEGIAVSLNNIGIIYAKQDNYLKSLDYLAKSLEIRELLGDKKGIASSLGNIGQLYSDHAEALEKLRRSKDEVRSKYERAVEYDQKSLAIAKEIGAKNEIKYAYQNLASVYYRQNKYKEAYDYHELYSGIKDSIINEQSNRQIAEMQELYESEKKEKQIEIQKLQLDKQQSDINKQRITLYSVIGGLILVLVFSLILFNRFRYIRKQNKIIEKQKQLVDEKNKDITDSIRYAKEIQSAILPADTFLDEILSAHFVVFKPKDIVSGDFYWAYKTKSNKVIWIAADCTGHGVPGAFMSMIGNALLNEIVIEKGIENAASILDELKSSIIKALSQTGKKGESRDGMDIALCVWHIDTNKLEFSGAHNPFYLLRKDIVNSDLAENAKVKIFENDLAEIKADRQPIGYEEGKDQPFTNHEIQLQTGDTLYIFSDGYADQFGGKRGKKFTYNQVKKLLLSINEKPMQEQKNVLDETIESWRNANNEDQIDDICVFGVRV